MVTAWKIKDENSLKKAENFNRDGLGLKREENDSISGGEDPDIWTMIMKKGDINFVNEIKMKVKGILETEEVLI